MALNLTDISGSDTIRGFVETHNKNNTTIEEYISNLETTISDLQSKIDSMEESHSKKINEISSKLTTMKSELEDKINKYLSEKYCAISSELSNSNKVVDVLRQTLNSILNEESTYEKIKPLSDNVKNVTKITLYIEPNQ